MSNAVDRLRGVRSSMAIKVPCRVATTSNITLSGLQTIDGVTLVDRDRVLVKDQSSGVENGIYEASTGPWRRAPDWDGFGDVVTGTLVLVNEGMANARTGWRVSTQGEIRITITPVQFFGPLGSVAVEIEVSSFIQTLLDDADATTARSTLGLGPSSSPQFNSINLGHASDTPLSRDTAGWLAVAGHALARRAPVASSFSSNFTLALADAGAVRWNNATGSVTVTVPTNTAVPFLIGTVINLVQRGSGGSIVATGDTGVTVNGVSAGSATCATRWQGLSLLKVGTDEWIASGALT